MPETPLRSVEERLRRLMCLHGPEIVPACYQCVTDFMREELAPFRALAGKVERYLHWLHAPCAGEIGPHVGENLKVALSALEEANAHPTVRRDAKGVRDE